MSFGELSSTGTHICKREKTQKVGPKVRANWGTKANAPRDLDNGPHVRLLEEDKDELLPGGVGRTQGSAEPGQQPVQVHFDVACPYSSGSPSIYAFGGNQL